MKNNVLRGLPAQVASDCRLLILGSMPGAVSLQHGCYYAHPRNRFWPLMQALFGVDAALPYVQRLSALQHNGIGLWDVIGQCERKGSLDAAIVRGSEVANPIAALIGDLPQLQLIACNGAAAAQAFRRWVLPDLTSAPQILSLPSTSPANAAWSLPRLQQAWAVLAGQAARRG